MLQGHLHVPLHRPQAHHPLGNFLWGIELFSSSLGSKPLSAAFSMKRPLLLLDIHPRAPHRPYVPPTEDDDDSARFVQYEFPAAFLKLRTVGAA